MIISTTLIVWIGGALLLLGSAMIYRLYRFKARSVEVWGYFRGDNKYNIRGADLQSTSYLPVVAFECPFTGRERVVEGKVGSTNSTAREGGTPMKVRVSKAPPHEALLWRWDNFLLPAVLLALGSFAIVLALVSFFRDLS